MILALRYKDGIFKTDIGWYRQTWYHPGIVIRYHSVVIKECRSDIVIMISFRHWIYNQIFDMNLQPEENQCDIRLQYHSGIGCPDISERYRNDIGMMPWMISSWYRISISMGDIKNWYRKGIVNADIKRYRFHVSRHDTIFRISPCY